MPQRMFIPKTTELSEVYRTTEQMCQKLPGRKWLVLPKYDGSKCLLIPREEGYVATTANGNIIECLPGFIERFNAEFGSLPLGARPVFETEIEPDPWTPENKVKLNGNLYKQAELGFGIKLSAFDCISLQEFMTQTEKGMGFRKRMETLTEYSPMLTKCGVNIAPYVEMTTEEMTEAFDRGVALGRNEHRVVFTPLPHVGPVEGFVARDPEAAYFGGRRNNNAIKLKPFVTRDILVTAVGRKDNGMAVLAGVDTKEPTQPYYVFTGLPTAMREHPEEMVGKIIEAEVLTTDDPKKGMGNPTFKAERPDKSFDGSVDPEVMAVIEKKIKDADMQLLASWPEIDLA